MDVEIPVRCACGCNHIIKSVVQGEMWNVEIGRCTCDDLSDDWERDFFNTEYHGGVLIVSNRFVPYNEYIKSDEWKHRKKRALKRAKFRCQVCNSGYNLNVHHRTYDRLGCERNDDLFVLCRECHKLYEDNKKFMVK